jgi:glycosyltransferase involved in cell wall biosynthesis
MIGKISDACPLVCLESQMCGTPVIARNIGPYPELIKHQISGFLCNSDIDIVKSITKINDISSQKVRQWAEDELSIEKCAKNYLKIYERMIKMGSVK